MKISFRGSLGHYEVIKTCDGSSTLLSAFFGEACHSLSGAYEETLYNYIQGCGVDKWTQNQGKRTLFEVGFGTGLGLEVTLREVKASPPPAYDFISTEIDERLAFYALEKCSQKNLISNISSHHCSEGSSKKESFSFFKADHPHGKVLILLGDARKVIPLWKESSLFERKVDAIYQDAFSPKRCPRLWTTQWFHLLGEISHSQTVMGTYSSTKAVWKSMVEAGWKIKAVKGFKEKKLSTRAFRQGEISLELLELMKRSPRGPLRDEELDLNAQGPESSLKEGGES